MSAEVTIFARDSRDRLGEGLMWSARDRRLYWTDILGRRLHRLDPVTRAVESWEMPATIGWVVERTSGGLVAGLGRAFVALSLDPFGIETIADPEPERDGNRFNDAKADRWGRIFAGSMAMSCDQPTGAFYRLDADGRVERLEDGYAIPNGPAIGDDYLFHTDTALRRIYRYAWCGDGQLGPRETHIEFEPDWGHPDGMTIDAEGCLWVACWGAGCVARFDPAGRRERVIQLPASQISNVAFAGEKLDRMFATSAAIGVDEPNAGALFEVDCGVSGRAGFAYAG